MTRLIWNDLDVDAWSQTQTLKQRQDDSLIKYAGYAPLDVNWWDLVQEIPLDIRYQSFQFRLNKMTEKYL